MEDNIIEIDGKKINLAQLSNEELANLQKVVEGNEKKYRGLIKEYIKKYPFLKDIKID